MTTLPPIYVADVSQALPPIDYEAPNGVAAGSYGLMLTIGQFYVDERTALGHMLVYWYCHGPATIEQLRAVRWPHMGTQDLVDTGERFRTRKQCEEHAITLKQGLAHANVVLPPFRVKPPVGSLL